MSEIALEIGGRSYAVACADGEEDHIRKLAQAIDAKVAALGGNKSHNDTKNLLFAALMLADELHEKGGKAGSSGDEGTAEALENLAQRLESFADRLESSDAAT